MGKIKTIFYNSYLFYIISILYERAFPAVKNYINNSFIADFFKKLYREIINSEIFKIIFDPKYISGLWYKSFFYRYTTLKIRKISYRITKSLIKYKPLYIGIFLSFLLIIPDKMWSNVSWILIYLAILFIYISRNIRNRAGTVMTIFNVVIFMFLIMIEIALPYRMVMSFVYLMIGIDIFFLISFSVRNIDDLNQILKPLFITGISLACLGYIQNLIMDIPALGAYSDSVRFGEILILIFPFIFAYAIENFESPRRIIYNALLFIFFLNAITAAQSKAALIGFIVEVAVFIMTDIKFFPFLIILMPLGLNSIIENIRLTWYATTTYGSFINNIIELSTKIWNLGFGVDRAKFMSFYNSSEIRAAAEESFINIANINISPVYVNFVIDICAIFMVFFFAYILRLAHSSLTMLITGDKKYKRYFTAGFATLVALSVSSFFETTLFASRTMLIYWAMLGILRSVRIMNLGVYES